jgi:cytochrome c oxidase cbb3-type subunit 1
VVRYTLPYLVSRSVAGTLIAIGHVAFVILFVLNLLRYGKRRQGPTLLHEEPPVEKQEALVGSAV